MNAIPEIAVPIIMTLAAGMTEPTFKRFTVLIAAAIMAHDRRTITRMIDLLGSDYASGDLSDYHRVMSRAPWNYRAMTQAVIRSIVRILPDDRPIVVAIDCTTAKHNGKRVFGKGNHRDACGSTQSKTRFVAGHRWIVMAVLVRLPYTNRPWALPIMTMLYRTKEVNKKEGRKHRTSIQLCKIMIWQLMRMMPEKQFVVVTDGGYNAHTIASQCAESRNRQTLVSRFFPAANLYTKPKSSSGVGRPRVKGRRLPKPQEAVEQAIANGQMKKCTVQWYAGKNREVQLLSQSGYWYKAGHGLVEVRWVYVHDPNGKRRDEYFYTTDVDMTPELIVEHYVLRWNIEVTFQESKEHLGFASPRNWCEKSVLRSGPCLLMLYSLIALIYNELCKTHNDIRPHSIAGYQKTHVTFADAIRLVRTSYWTAWINEQVHLAKASKKELANCISQLKQRLANTT